MGYNAAPARTAGMEHDITSSVRPVPSVGVEAWDDDHEMLLALADHLGALAADDGGVTLAMVELLTRMYALTRCHFVAEEDMMRAAAFEGLDAHRFAHDSYLNWLSAELEAARRQLDGRSDDGESDWDALATARRMTRWWTDHVHRVDAEYVDHCKMAISKLMAI